MAGLTKVFAKLNGQSTDRLMQPRLGAAPPPTTNNNSSNNKQLHLQAVFINYDREASLEKRAKRFGPGRRSQVNDSNLCGNMRRHQVGGLVDVVATAAAPVRCCCMQLIEGRHHHDHHHRHRHCDHDLGSRQASVQRRKQVLAINALRLPSKRIKLAAKASPY